MTNIGICTYGARLNFLIFDSVQDTGFELILVKTWHVTINLRHSIDHVQNVMTIGDKGSCLILKGSAPPDRQIDADRVDDIPQTGERYVSRDQKAAEEGLLEEQETAVTTEMTVRPQGAANPAQSPDSFVTAHEEVGDLPPGTPLEPPQVQTTRGSSYGVMDYHVFVAISIFLPPHLYSNIEASKALFPVRVLAIKAVAQQRHSPNQGTLVS